MSDSESSRERKPCLRPVEAFPLEMEGARVLCLRDRLGIADGPVIIPLSPLALFLLQHFDGTHTLAELQLLFLRQSGEMILTEQFEEFANTLDELGYLEGSAFEERIRKARQTWMDLEERPCLMAPPGEKEEEKEAAAMLREFWRKGAEHALGPGADPPPTAFPQSVCAILAPHIDYARGAYAYAWAYQALARATPAARAKTYVILGTIHHPMETPFAATRKPFRSLFGRAPVNVDFLQALQARLDGIDLFESEFAHASEHSIELQVLYLQHVLANRDGWNIVPILVDSFEADVEARRSPTERPEVEAFLGALGETIREAGGPDSVCLIGGVDFAHVGPRFGAEAPVSELEMESVARRDREMLERIEQGDAEGFMRGFFEDGNARNVCSIAPIYCILRLLDGRARGRTLRYGQAVDADRMGAVTFGAVAFSEIARECGGSSDAPTSQGRQ